MKRIIFSFLILFLTSWISFAQEIKGNVSDEKGLPLPGVNVTVSGTDKGTSTDFDGNFTLSASIGDQLVFSMIGFETVTTTATSNMTIKMKEETNSLSEVVVIGYGTRKVGSITGSISQVKAEDIVRTPAQSAIQAIQGKAAGVNIVTNDEPGANPSIRIRGLGTILGGRDPLYVIDGIEAGSLNGLSPNDVATINILKDASSLAIYGQKGSNGVVLITTKSGKKGNVKVSYNAYYGQKSIQKKVDMADSYRYAYYNNTALGSSDFFNFNQPVNTDWLDEITRTGEVTSNSISLSGASETANYYLGVTHYTEKGILLGTDYKRTNVINKNEYKVAGDRLKINHFMNLSIVDNAPKPLSAFTNAYKQSPIMPVRYDNGRWGAPLVNEDNGLNDLTGTEYEKYNNVANPVAQLYQTNQRNKNITLSGSIGAELKILQDLKFNSNFGVTADWGRGYTFNDLEDIWLAQNPFSTPEDYIDTFGDKTVLYNTLEQRRSEFYNWNWDNYLTYKKEFGKHSLTVVAGMSRTTSNNSDYINGIRYNVPKQTNYWSLDFSTNNELINPRSVVRNEHETPRVSLAYFGRFEYEFDSKYLLSASVRREGISVFQGDKKWGVFPAVSAGWVLSQEDFLKDIKFLDLLKLRGGYGEVGNGNGPSYNQVSFTGNRNYSFGVAGIINPGSNVANAVDPNLTWETMKEIDLGLDFAVLNNRLTGTIDYYNRKSVDVILELTLPPVLSEGKVYVNSGEITNKGIEVSLRWQDNINDNLNYWVGGNFSRNENEVSRANNPYFQNQTGSGDLGNGQWTKAVAQGESLGSFYVYDQIGYNSDGAPLFDDMVDGVAGLTQDDRIFAGSYIPTFTYGLNVGLNYRNFDFSVDAYGVGGNKIYNGKKAQRFGGENIEYDLLDSFWTPSTPNAINPRPSNDVPRPSTYYLEKGDYLRINNITLGYTLPKFFEKLDKVRLYVTAVNPFLFTKYSGYSPEVVGGDNANPLGTAGIELDAYPTNKTFLFGVNVNF